MDRVSSSRKGGGGVGGEAGGWGDNPGRENSQSKGLEERNTMGHLEMTGTLVWKRKGKMVVRDETGEIEKGAVPH